MHLVVLNALEVLHSHIASEMLFQVSLPLTGKICLPYVVRLIGRTKYNFIAGFQLFFDYFYTISFHLTLQLCALCQAHSRFTINEWLQCRTLHFLLDILSCKWLIWDWVGIRVMAGGLQALEKNHNHHFRRSLSCIYQCAAADTITALLFLLLMSSQCSSFALTVRSTHGLLASPLY